MARYFDLTLPLHSTIPVYPGDPPFRLETVTDTRTDGGYRLSRLQLSTHTGTHIDAPQHFFTEGKPAEVLPLAILCGEATVIQLDREGAILPEAVAPSLRDQPLRVLLGSRKDGALYPRPASYLTAETAALLYDSGVRLLGIDSMSIDATTSDTFPAHQRLLAAEVIIIENLDLRLVPAGRYLLYCLPLPIVGGDGAPARVVLQEIEKQS